MTDTITLQMGQRGVITFPKSLQETYRFKSGDKFTLLDIGGVFVLSPVSSQIDTLANQITQSLVEQGETLENMLRDLRKEREQYP